MHDRRIEPRRTVGDAHIAAAPALCGAQHAHHLGQERRRGGAQHLDLDLAGEIQRSGLEIAAWPGGDWHRLAGDDRAVEIGRPLPDPRVDRQSLTCGNDQHHAWHDFLDGPPDLSAIGGPQHRPLGREFGKSGHGAPGAVAHQLVEIAAGEQEKEQRHGGVEEYLFAAPRRFEQAQCQCQNHRQRDRHVHVETAGPQCPERR